MAQAREHFREVLDRVGAGDVVEVTRRGEVVAVIAPPSAGQAGGESFAEALHTWREAWNVDSWTEDDPFGDVRDREPGREPPW